MSISETATGKKDWPISQDLWNLPRNLAVFCNLSETWYSLMSDNSTVVINTRSTRINIGHLATRMGINHCCLMGVVLSLCPSKYNCGEWFCRWCLYFNDSHCWMNPVWFIPYHHSINHEGLILECIKQIFLNGPRCDRNVHKFLLQNGALWDIGLVHCGICEKIRSHRTRRVSRVFHVR